MPKGRKISVSFVSEPLPSNSAGAAAGGAEPVRYGMTVPPPPMTTTTGRGHDDNSPEGGGGGDGDDEEDDEVDDDHNGFSVSDVGGQGGRRRRHDQQLLKVVQQKLLRLQVTEVILSLLLVVLSAVAIIEERVLFSLGFTMITSVVIIVSAVIGIQQGNPRLILLVNLIAFASLLPSFYFTFVSLDYNLRHGGVDPALVETMARATSHPVSSSNEVEATSFSTDSNTATATAAFPEILEIPQPAPAGDSDIILEDEPPSNNIPNYYSTSTTTANYQNLTFHTSSVPSSSPNREYYSTTTTTTTIGSFMTNNNNDNYSSNLEPSTNSSSKKMSPDPDHHNHNHKQPLHIINNVIVVNRPRASTTIWILGWLHLSHLIPITFCIIYEIYLLKYMYSNYYSNI